MNTSEHVTATRLDLDVRLDPRIKAYFGAFPPAGEKPNVASREVLLAQENSPEVLAAMARQKALFDSMDSEEVAPSTGLSIRVETVTSAPDGNTIKIQYIRPDNDETLPCVYYIHGGRMEMNSCFDGNYKTWGRMIAGKGVAVAMVEFRNSVHPSAVPEIAPFPAGLNDCISGLKWVVANAAGLGIDPRRIIVAGESGGGNLTFAVGMKLKRDGEIGLIRGLYSLCPYIAGEWPLPQYPSSSENEGIVLHFQDNRATMAYGIEAFNARDPLAWPSFATSADVQGLPPTVISVNECDPLRDEGVAFYRLLLANGVSARCRQVMGACHGIEIFPVVCPDIAHATASDIANFVTGSASPSSKSPEHCEPASNVPAPAKSPFFPDNEEYWFETLRTFGAASYGASDFGEVMATVNRIPSGDAESWYREWNATAERVYAEAQAQQAEGHPVSARDGYLRASNYFRTSEFFLHGNHEDPRIYSAYQKSITAYQLGCPLYDTPILPVEIPYESTTLPGYFHRVDEAGTQRPLLILHTGFDGSAEEMHSENARAGVERGWNVLVFDGPGQYGPIHRERLPFRPDWENVVTSVVDFALTLPGVDPEKIALMGVSMGGYLAPRAAAFEKRIKALVANDGIYDFGAPQLAAIPPDQRESFIAAINQKDAPELDRKIVAGAQKSPSAKWALDQAGFVMGEPTPHAVVAKIVKFNLRDGIAEQISCPTLVLDAEEDLYLKGQPDELYKHLTCPKTMIRFTTAEGAGAHCQCGADRLANARIFDWLDKTFGLAGKF